MTINDLKQILIALNARIAFTYRNEHWCVTLTRKADDTTIIAADADLDHAIEKACARFIEFRRKNPTKRPAMEVT